MQQSAALVAKRFLTAMSQGNVNEVRTRIVDSERARFDEMMQSPDKSKMLEMMKMKAKARRSRRHAGCRGRGHLREGQFVRQRESAGARRVARHAGSLPLFRL